MASISVVGQRNSNSSRSRSPSPEYLHDDHAPVATARGGNPALATRGGIYGKAKAPVPPVVLAEVNVTNDMVHPRYRDAYARFDEILEQVHGEEDADYADDEAMRYSDMMTSRRNGSAKTLQRRPSDFQREKIANYTIEMDSDEENENPLRIRGILKPPKRVEFNKDVDVALFGTLSRHESLESLYGNRGPTSGFDTNTRKRRRQVRQSRTAYGIPTPPSYTSVVEERPLDDTDLYMYTMRRRRRGPTVFVAREGYAGTSRMHRNGSLRASGGRRHHARTVRVAPAAQMW